MNAIVIQKNIYWEFIIKIFIVNITGLIQNIGQLIKEILMFIIEIISL